MPEIEYTISKYLKYFRIFEKIFKKVLTNKALDDIIQTTTKHH